MNARGEPTLTSTDAAATRAKVMERVRRLLDLAEHPNTGEEEAAIASAHAAALMLRHGLDAAAIRRGSTGRAETIDGLEFEVSNRGGHAKERCWALHLVCQALGCKGAQHWTGVKGRGVRGAKRVTMTVIGPEAVLDSLRILLPSITLQMENQVGPAARRHAPSFRAGANGPSAPAGENDTPVASTRWWHPAEGAAVTDHRSAQNVAAAADRRPLDATVTAAAANRAPRDTTNFRRAFYVGFGSGVAAKLRDRVAEVTEQVKGTGAELVLLDRTTLVQAEFERRFPGLRRARTTTLDHDGFHTGRDAGHRADLNDRDLGDLPIVELPR